MSEEILNDEFTFDLSERIKPVKIKQRDGSVKEYELHEASEDAAVKWRDYQLRSARMDRQGNIKSVGDVAGSEPFLVSLCLVNKDTGKHVSEQVLREWGSRIIKPLYRWIVDVSDLKEDEQVKKKPESEPDAGEDTSD